MHFSDFYRDFTALFYPHLCLACGNRTPPEKEDICITCQYKLPKTNFHLEKENQFTERFWGRIPLEAGAAMYYFRKGGLTQKLIHQLKYSGKKEAGARLGELYSIHLKKAPVFNSIDIIVPVPLHPKKERSRGYNQSAYFARGLANGLMKNWYPDAVKRSLFSPTQTKKGVLERLENVDKIFELKKPDLLKDKHVLVVDDVLTTGATLEACAETILAVPGTRVSMATIAIAFT